MVRVVAFRPVFGVRADPGAVRLRWNSPSMTTWEALNFTLARSVPTSNELRECLSRGRFLPRLSDYISEVKARRTPVALKNSLDIDGLPNRQGRCRHLLSGRTQPKKASFRHGRRELILTHETRSQCLGRPVKCLTSSYKFVNSHPSLNRLFRNGRVRRGTVPFRAAPGVAGLLPALPTHTPGIRVNKSSRHTNRASA